MKPVVVLAVLVAMTSAARASFDLMFVVDGTSRQIHRVDPINRVALGSFGAGFLANPLSVALDGQNNVLVLDNPGSAARVRRFNGSTGEYLGGFALPFFVGAGARMRVSGNRIYTTLGSITGTAFMFVTDLNGVFIPPSGFLAGTEAAVTGQGVAVINNRVIWAGDQPVFGVHNFYTTTTSAPIDGSFINYFWQEARAGSTMAHLSSSATRLLYTSSNGYCTLWDANLNYTGNVNVTGFTSVAGTAAGHADMFHLAGMAGGMFSVSRLFANTNDGLPPVSIAGTGITDPRDIAVIVAPEPGTMAALGLGVVALLRRRKSR